MANEQNIAVVGGGISGLVMAKELADSGNKVTVFEELKRLGGKIQTGALDGKSINLGAEFVDTDNKHIIGLCNELGVKLIPATDQKTEQFHTPDGKLLSGEAFHAEYKPIAELIIADKQNLIVDNKYTERAKHLSGMSLDEYMHELAAKANPAVDPKIVETAIGVYCAEAGQDRNKVSALMFVNEASSERGSFLGSDCGFRIEGGTERLIDALRQHLQAKGVKFETGAKANKVVKENGKFQLGFEGAQLENYDQKFDKVSFALPMHALSKIEGLEALGMKTEERELLKNGQYTHSSKFFVKVKDGVKIDDACVFSHEGFEAWQSEKGIITFLAGGEKINEMKGKELVNHCLDSYAKAHGKKVDDLFEVTPDKIVFAAPDTKRPCYASPAVGDLIKMGSLFTAMERMAQSGVVFAGTYLPLRTKDNSLDVGFMECGAASAKRAAKLLNQPSVEQSVKVSAVSDESWAHKIYTGVRNTIANAI